MKLWSMSTKLARLPSSIAENAHVARGQRATDEQPHITRHFRAGKPTISDDVEVATHLDAADIADAEGLLRPDPNPGQPLRNNRLSAEPMTGHRNLYPLPRRSFFSCKSQATAGAGYFATFIICTSCIRLLMPIFE